MTKNTNKNYALVTGVSNGPGREIASELAIEEAFHWFPGIGYVKSKVEMAYAKT